MQLWNGQFVFLVIDGFSAEWKTDDDSLFSQGIDIQIFK